MPSAASDILSANFPMDPIASNIVAVLWWTRM
jgi:hypothetical protein